MQIENFSPTHVDRLDHVKALDEEERHAWLKRERDFWENILKSTQHTTNDTSNRSLIHNYIQLVDKMLFEFSDFDAIQNLQNEAPLPLHDEHPHNDQLKDFVTRGQLGIALYLFRALLKQQSALYISKYKSELQKLEEKFKNALNNEQDLTAKNLEEKIDSLTVFTEAQKKQVYEKFTESLNGATEALSNLTTAATNAILTAEPVKYWEEREAKHRNKARSYRYGVIIAAVVFISTLIFLTLSVYKNGETYTVAGVPLTLPAEKFSIALLIITTTAAIWLVRVLVKLMMTNLALEIEALERSTMIKTYIAMDSTKAEQASEIRMLFYTTLFRPSSNSLADDSTSPEYIRIIEAMLQKKS